MKLTENLQKQVEKAVFILRNGGLVAYPTDTVYGLGASAKIKHAVERIYQVKRRPVNMALPLLLAHISQMSECAASVPPLAWFLAGRFLPGALTLILYKSRSVSPVITAGSDKVALRIPAHPVPVAIVKALGAPLVGTSANLHDRPSAVTAGEVASQIGTEIDMVIDGGVSPGGIESTIVDVTGEKPVIVREGAISKAEIECACALFDPSIVVV